MRALAFTFLSLVLSSSAVFASMPISSPWMKPDTWQAAGACGGSYYFQGAHTGALQYGIDFNRRTASPVTCNTDPGYPILAVADGTVLFARSSGDYGNLVKIAHGTYGGKVVTTYYAHLKDAKPFGVVEGEQVLAGQVIGYCGSTGNSSSDHLHFELREDGVSVAVTSMDGFNFCTSCGGQVQTSNNAGAFDRAHSTWGSWFGSKNGDVHWYHSYDPNNLYGSDGVPKNSYVQDYNQGQYYGHIEYDALGGARKAYPIIMGFFTHWTTRGGPGNEFGQPLGPEYSTGSNSSRQEFQRKYLTYVQGRQPEEIVGYNYPVCAPGWTANGWDPQVSYRISDEYYTKGAFPHFGNATGVVQDVGIAWRQSFTNGFIEVPKSFSIAQSGGVRRAGDYNGDGKRDAGLYEPAYGGWFVATSNGSSFTPSPTAWLGNWGANPTAYRSLEGDFTGDGKADVGLYEPAYGGWYVAVSNGSAFTPSPSGWLGNWGVSTTAYIELTGDFNGDGKCDVGLYEPAYGGWYVATSSGSSFTPSPSGWLGNWGASLTAYKVLTGDFNGDGKCDVGLYEPAYGGWYVAISTGSAFVPSPSGWLGNWGANVAAYRPIAGDFTGDGKCDVGLYEPAYGGWYVAVSNGSAFTPSPSGWLGNWGVGTTTYLALVADFTGDGKTDVGLYDPAYGGWYVATSNGSSFTPSPSAWLGDWGANGSYQVLKPGPAGPPVAFELQSHPNPFNPVTEIHYAISTPGRVHLQIFDTRGRLVTMLVNAHLEIGRYVVAWHGTDQHGQAVASGVYFAHLTEGDHKLTTKLVVAR